ncbi:hypothetical protein Hanom_Chr03g00253441 [Helianthus anomalus]
MREGVSGKSHPTNPPPSHSSDFPQREKGFPAPLFRQVTPNKTKLFTPLPLSNPRFSLSDGVTADHRWVVAAHGNSSRRMRCQSVGSRRRKCGGFRSPASYSWHHDALICGYEAYT